MYDDDLREPPEGVDRERFLTCIRKKAYPEEVADRVVKKVLRERQVELRKYQCPYCGLWHVTKRQQED